MSAAPADRLLGALIDGRYRVDRLVGAGGFGTVYRAFHVGLGAPVALKVLALGDVTREPEQLARHVGALLEEARTLKRLQHPNIAAALDVGFLPEDAAGARLPYLVMEWCGGPTLKQMLERRGGAPLSPGEAWLIFEPLLAAVEHAHAAGVVHRDLKPGNVILEALEGGAWRPRVIDFGIAKMVAPDDAAGTGKTRTGSGASPFTPRYAAPEQLAGARTGPWTDVHALALVFVELVTGRPAIGADGDGLGGLDPHRPTPGARGVDVGALEPVLGRALALRPADRYADASALAHAMRAVVASGSLELPSATQSSLVPTRLAPPGGDGTGPPSSHTLHSLSGQRTAEAAPLPIRRSRRSRRWKGLVAFAALAGAVALGLGVTAGVQRAAGFATAPGLLRDLSTAELERRVQSLGFGECTLSKTSTFLSYGCPQGLVLFMGVGGDFASREDVRAQVNGTALGYVSLWGAARYAIDGTRAVIVATSPDAVEAALETLIGGASVETRARAESQQAPALSAAARKALAAWTGTDLWAAAALAGEQIIYISASTEPASVVVKSGDETWIPMLYTKHARRVLDALRGAAAKATFAYALDGDVLLVINGDPARINAGFMRKLLGGARAAEVGVSTPAR